MSKSFRIGVSLLLSALILLGGSGVAFGKMTCLKSGHTKYALGEFSDCCKKGETETALNNQCCDIYKVVFERAHFVPEGQAILKAGFPVKVFFSDILSPVTVAQTSFVCNREEADPPPSLHERSPQSFLSVFRI